MTAFLVLQVLADSGHLVAVAEAAYTELDGLASAARRLQASPLIPLADLAAVFSAISKVCYGPVVHLHNAPRSVASLSLLQSKHAYNSTTFEM